METGRHTVKQGSRFIDVSIQNGDMRNDEIMQYVKYVEAKHQRRIKAIDILIDGEDVELRFEFVPVPFERIRRITGYLVGDMSSWNNAKKAEEHDRVKHGHF